MSFSPEEHQDEHREEQGGSQARPKGRWAGLRHELSEMLPFGHSHEHDGGGIAEALEASEEGIRALKISLAGLLVTALLQAVVVAFSGSVALLADTIHNFGDALTAVPLWIAFALSRRASNRSYTYGYGRSEDLAGVFIVATIFFSALVAGYQSVLKLIEGSEVSNVGWVAGAAVIGFAGNELVARFRIRVGRRIKSAALVADGKHARTDGFTSLAVLFGAIGVWIGVPILDPIVGLIITVAILFIVKDSARSIYARMMDEVEPELVDRIEKSASEVPGVSGIKAVRARWVGHRLHSEVELYLPDDLSVATTARIKEQAYSAVKQQVPALERLVVEPAVQAH